MGRGILLVSAFWDVDDLKLEEKEKRKRNVKNE